MFVLLGHDTLVKINNNVSYQQHLCHIETAVEGVHHWLWVQGNAHESGSFEGPRLDWDARGNREAYFKHMRGWDTVVQAGGNCGLYPRLLAKYFKHVYTFEPDALNFHCLVHNCQQDNIVKIMGALGDKNQLVRVLRHDMSNVGGHQVSETEGTAAYVPMLTIDSLHLTSCDFLLLDCEGYEPNIIAGALQTIGQFKPVISVETCTPQLMSMLATWGYELADKPSIDHVLVPRIP